MFIMPFVGLAQKKKPRNDEVSKLIMNLDSTHRADSVYRVAMQKEIDDLKGSLNNKQRQSLVDKLATLQKADSIKRSGKLMLLEELKATTAGAPVAPFSDTIFFVYTRVGSFSATDRAVAIERKIQKLYDDYKFFPDSLSVNVSETGPEIVYHDVLVMTVNELEAMWVNQKPEILAQQYQKIIQRSITEERVANSTRALLIKAAAVILIVLGFYLVILVVNKLFGRLTRRLVSLKDTSLKGIKIKNYQLLDSKRALKIILFFSNAMRLVIILIVLYLTLPLLFSVFPWTQGMGDVLMSWITTPLKIMGMAFIHYLPNLFTIAVIIFITRYVVKFLMLIAREIESGSLKIPGFYPDWTRPTVNIVKFLIYAFSFIIIFPYLPGSDSPIFQGVSVFLGILFSLGSSSAISNAVAGLVITYMRPFKIGDRVKIGEITGDVVEKSFLVTRIRTIKNENITIPNASILSGHTINYTTSAKELGLILNTGVTIGYDVPWKQVHGLLIAAASETNGMMNDDQHKPFVLQTSLDDFYVSYQINGYTDQPHRMAAIYSELHQNIQNKFNESGVEIMSPHYKALRDGNTTTVPTDYLGKDYNAPSFRVSNPGKPIN